MSLCLKIFAVAGMIYYYETRRETAYFKKSHIARLPITLTKWAIILGFIALVFASDIYFISSMFSA